MWRLTRGGRARRAGLRREAWWGPAGAKPRGWQEGVGLMGSWHGILAWDPGMGSWHGILAWDPGMGS
jgi:hypothetical protein